MFVLIKKRRARPYHRPGRWHGFERLHDYSTSFKLDNSVFRSSRAFTSPALDLMAVLFAVLRLVIVLTDYYEYNRRCGQPYILAAQTEQQKQLVVMPL